MAKEQTGVITNPIPTPPKPPEPEEDSNLNPEGEETPPTEPPKIDMKRLSIEDLEEEEEEEKKEGEGEEPEKPEGEEPEKPELSEQPLLIDEIGNAIGLDFGEEVFSDSVEGIVGMVRKSAEQFAQNGLNNLFKEYADVGELYNYLRNGGTADRFYQVRYGQEDYSKVELADDNVSSQEFYVSEKLRHDGFTDEQVTAKVSRFKAAGILSDEAKDALSWLSTKQSEQQTNLLSEQEDYAKEEQEKVDTFWEEAESSLEKRNTFAGFTIPETQKAKLLSFMKDPVSESEPRSKLVIAQQNLTTDQRIAISFLFLNDFNIDDIISRKARSMNAEKLRERLTETDSTGKLTSEISEEGGPSDPASFDFASAPPLI